MIAYPDAIYFIFISNIYPAGTGSEPLWLESLTCEEQAQRTCSPPQFHGPMFPSRLT